MSAHFTTNAEEEVSKREGVEAGVEGGRVHCGRLADKLSRVAVDMWLWQQITNELSPFVTTFRAFAFNQRLLPFWVCMPNRGVPGGREAGNCHGLGTS